VAEVLFIEEEPLDREWLKAQLSPEEYSKSSITRAVKCWRGGQKDVPVKAINCCREAYLQDDLKAFQGKKIVALGNVSYKALTGTGAKMQEVVGLPFRVGEAWALATWQPTMVERIHQTQWMQDIVRTINWAFGGKIK
jgi:uracil-DNA glycosylase